MEENGKYSFYKEYEDDFRKHLVLPFRKLILEGVTPRLPEKITDLVETQRRIFGQINKSDFGRGGANPFYWAAFYPKRSASKQQDFQLLTFINSEVLEFGFFPGWQTSEEYQQQLVDNYDKVCQSGNFDSLVSRMESRLPGEKLTYRDSNYPKENFELSKIGSLVSKNDAFKWHLFFQESEASDSPMVVLPKETVVKMSFDELSQSIATSFEGLFPLMFFATTELAKQVDGTPLKIADIV